MVVAFCCVLARPAVRKHSMRDPVTDIQGVRVLVAEGHPSRGLEPFCMTTVLWRDALAALI